MFFFFFFASRRRHTRCYRDWSSDVCSSDLQRRRCHHRNWCLGKSLYLNHCRADEIGRASCRERVSISVVAVSLKKKKKKRGEQVCSVARGASGDAQTGEAVGG